MLSRHQRLGGTQTSGGRKGSSNRPTPLTKEQFIGRLQAIIEPTISHDDLQTYRQSLRDLSKSVEEYADSVGETRGDESLKVGEIFKTIIEAIRRLPRVGRIYKEGSE